MYWLALPGMGTGGKTPVSCAVSLYSEDSPLPLALHKTDDNNG